MASVLSHPVSVAEPPAGEITVTANEAARVALAKTYEVLSVDALSGTATVTPAARGALLVEGRVTGDVVQACVVSLVPVTQHIDETFSVRFAPEAEVGPGKEVVVDVEAPDPPEPITGPSIDVGALIEEYFALAIDPYPRAPGAALPADLAEPAEDSPFAVLKGLLDPSRKG
jgi:uncharacterized metal-binding protein YceD (DUF177 family)